VVARAERVHGLGLHTLGGAVEHVNLEVILRAHQSREQADRTGARYERALVS
jgi:hypothetical protein